jgi:hypothetical protein
MTPEPPPKPLRYQLDKTGDPDVDQVLHQAQLHIDQFIRHLQETQTTLYQFYVSNCKTNNTMVRQQKRYRAALREFRRQVNRAKAKYGTAINGAALARILGGQSAEQPTTNGLGGLLEQIMAQRISN